MVINEQTKHFFCLLVLALLLISIDANFSTKEKLLFDYQT